MDKVEKMKMILEVKIRNHERMVSYHEAKEEMVKATFHENILTGLYEMLQILTSGVFF